MHHGHCGLVKDPRSNHNESFLVQYILCSLPLRYSPFKISYNTHKKDWSISELLTMCVQKEERLLVEQRKKVLFTLPNSKGKNNAKNKGNGKTQPKSSIKKESMCFFCKNKGHMKDYAKHKVWLEKKSTSFSFVCYESNFTNVNHNTWWIDSSSTIHVSNTLQGMRNLRKPVGSERYIHSRERSSSHVEAIGTCSLKLSRGFVLQLENTFYVPSFSRNLFSISALNTHRDFL